MIWRVDDILKATGGMPVRVKRETFRSVSTDSRTISEGELFVPIVGENFDAHLFLAEAQKKSQAGFLCDESRKYLCDGIDGTAIIVQDTLRALLDLALYKRRLMDGTFIAITGSNGKTTTKEVLVGILKHSFSVAFNEKNYNNLVGVPKTILAMEGNPRFCVLELGTNRPGEIGLLAGATEPDLSLITNVNPSHLEGLGDIEGVLQEKLDLFLHTGREGVLFINADDRYLASSWSGTKPVAASFGIDSECDYRLILTADLGWEGYTIGMTFPGGVIENIHVRLIGKHNLYNVAASMAIAISNGIGEADIRNGVEEFRPYAMRFSPVRTKEGIMIVDDTYNANPSSMQWALSTFLSLPSEGRRIAILGDMRELGEKSPDFHRELGKFLKESAISRVLFVGDAVKEAYDKVGPERAEIFSDKRDAIACARDILKRGDTVLVKGSRLQKMEEIVEALT